MRLHHAKAGKTQLAGLAELGRKAAALEEARMPQPLVDPQAGRESGFVRAVDHSPPAVSWRRMAKGESAMRFSSRRRAASRRAARAASRGSGLRGLWGLRGWHPAVAATAPSSLRRALACRGALRRGPL